MHVKFKRSHIYVKRRHFLMYKITATNPLQLRQLSQMKVSSPITKSVATLEHSNLSSNHQNQDGNPKDYQCIMMFSFLTVYERILHQSGDTHQSSHYDY